MIFGKVFSLALGRSGLDNMVIDIREQNYRPPGAGGGIDRSRQL